MLAQVLIAEADAFVAMWKDEKLSDGRDRIVRHGHGPHRAIQTGVGPVEVRRAKVRDRGEVGTEKNPFFLGDFAEMGAADEEPRRAVAGSLPARSINRRFPGGACRPPGQGRAELVASRYLAADGGVAGGLRHLAEARSLGTAIRVRVGRRGLSPRPDGRQRRMHAGADRRDTRGQERLVGFQTGVRESAQSWRELLIDIRQRGLEIAPDLAVGDGALGFWKSRRSFRAPGTSAVGFTRPLTC